MKHITENIFDFNQFFNDEYKKDIEKSISFIRQENEKLIKNIEKFTKQFNENSLFEENTSITGMMYVLNKAFKKIYEDINTESVKTLSNFNIKNSSDFKGFMDASPPFSLCIVLEKGKRKNKYDKYKPKVLETKNAQKKFKENPKKLYFISLTVVPKKNFFSNLYHPVYRELSNSMFFNSSKYNDFEYELFRYHELHEINEYTKIIQGKTVANGELYVKAKNGRMVLVGNHNTILVLAKEATVLNKFKQLKMVTKLRDLRKKIEWLIIKDKTGVDFSVLTTITPTIEKKLRRAKITPLDYKKLGKIKLSGLKI